MIPTREQIIAHYVDGGMNPKEAEGKADRYLAAKGPAEAPAKVEAKPAQKAKASPPPKPEAKPEVRGALEAKAVRDDPHFNDPPRRNDTIVQAPSNIEKLAAWVKETAPVTLPYRAAEVVAGPMIDRWQAGAAAERQAAVNAYKDSLVPHGPRRGDVIVARDTLPRTASGAIDMGVTDFPRMAAYTTPVEVVAAPVPPVRMMGPASPSRRDAAVMKIKANGYSDADIGDLSDDELIVAAGKL